MICSNTCALQEHAYELGCNMLWPAAHSLSAGVVNVLQTMHSMSQLTICRMSSYKAVAAMLRRFSSMCMLQ